MQLNINDVIISIENFMEEDYRTVHTQMIKDMTNKKIKNRDIIKNAFSTAVKLAPEANPSDLWHHVIYRMYLAELHNYRIISDVGQSWKRASGDAFELFLTDYYNLLLQSTSIRLVPLVTDRDRILALSAMNIYGKVGDSKLDIAIIKNYNGRSLNLESGEVIGGIHAKVSLAERVSDDVPASIAMMRNGYCSYLFTLDVKSFPLSETIEATRAYINKGELGSPTSPSDKRKYIEEHGSFDACFSLNLRTTPSAEITSSGKRIFIMRPNGSRDVFCNLVFEQCK